MSPIRDGFLLFYPKHLEQCPAHSRWSTPNSYICRVREGMNEYVKLN